VRVFTKGKLDLSDLDLGYLAFGGYLAFENHKQEKFVWKQGICRQKVWEKICVEGAPLKYIVRYLSVL